jgi:hypothetical protein
MVTAAIVINQSGKPSGSPSTSRDDLALGVTVSLSNNSNTGVATWQWEFISKPPASAAALTTPTSATSTFTPDIRGSYFIKLTVTNGGSASDSDQRVAAIKTSYLGIRIPAVEEKDDFSLSQGWGDAMHNAFLTIDAYAAQSLHIDGTNFPTENISWNDKKITDLHDPADSYDAANKHYVDTLFATAFSAVEDTLDSTGTETYISLTKIPRSTSFEASGKDLQVYRNGVLIDFVSSLGSDLNQWTYNGSLNRVQFVASTYIDRYTAVYNSSTESGGGGSLAIQSDGVTVETTASILNFIGVGISVESSIVGSKVNIYVPPLVYAPYFNVGAATISDISTYSRYVAAPTAEGTPFKIGDWIAGTLHPCTNTGSWIYSTGAACSFKTDTTTLEITVLDADGATPIASHLTAAITGNTDVTDDNIRIQVTGWQTDGARFKGLVTVTINIAAILTSSGRCSISLTHHNNGTDYTKLQSNVLYDSNPNAAAITGGTVSISESSAVTKYISGIEFYSIGSEFSVSVSDIDFANCNSYPSIVLNVEAPLYALPTLNVSTTGLTGWTNIWNNTNSSYSNLVWEITTPNVFTMSISSVARARIIDWSASGYQTSAVNNILIDTYSTVSTRLFEGFRDESWRCAITADFDAPDSRGWDSSLPLGSGDACYINSGCERNTTDFTIYNPNPTLQQDLSSGMDSTVYLIREFKTSGVASSGFTIVISGSYTSLEYKLAGPYDGTPNSGTEFINMLAYYNASLFNNGDPLGGSGSLTGAGSLPNSWHHTFGPCNIINTSGSMYVMVGFSSSERIIQMEVIFD